MRQLKDKIFPAHLVTGSENVLHNQQPVRVLQGVITAFERLSTAKEETRYALTLQPRLALLSKSNAKSLVNRRLQGQRGVLQQHLLRGDSFIAAGKFNGENKS
jgi:uncharacterized protein involved in type VI secretion and phage assembly